jgi:hypothetical protein
MKSKMMIFMVAAVMAVASVSSANVYVSWQSGGGFILGSSVGATMGTTANSVMAAGSGASVLLQLIWSPDSTASLASMAYGPTLVGDGEFLLDSFVITEAGTTGTRFASFAAGSRPTVNNAVLASGGSLYGRIFETATPTVGSWYYNGLVVGASNLDPTLLPAPLPQDYRLVPTTSEFTIGTTRIASVNQTGAGSPLTHGFSAQVLPVPEPGTMALFAMGVVTLAAARRRRKGVTA